MGELLAENRYLRKRSAANSKKSHRDGVAGRTRERRKREPKTPLQALFIRRVGEELHRLGWSVNELGVKSKSLGGAPQRTIADVMSGADPRLETVYQIATALGLPAYQLLTESDGKRQSRFPDNVRELPKPPGMFAPQQKPTKPRTLSRDRKGSKH